MRVARLPGFACARGHAYLHAQDACPACGASLSALFISPHATLVLATIVRVNPAGEPFALGIAVTLSGRARTLCRIEGGIRGHGHDRVVLEKRGDVFVARRCDHRGGAVTESNPAPHPKRPGSQKS